MRRRTFLALAGACAAFPAWAGGERYERGLLWSVSAADGAASHLFATFQAPAEKLGSLPREALRALDAAERLVVETPPDAYASPRLRDAATFRGGQTLEQAIGAADFERAAAALREYGLPKEVVNQLKPWAILLNLGAAGGAQASPPDPRLAAYLRGDLAGIARTGEEHDARFPGVAPHQAVLAKRVLHDRSVVMAHRMQRGLRGGGSFVAIGALHLYGPNGVPALLEKAGYRMARVY
ncbi:MAG: TraB/GumN family protein [Betaproteobacteria bacterium]